MKSISLLMLSLVLGTGMCAYAQVENDVQNNVEKINLKVGQSWSRVFRSLPGAGFLWMVKNTDPSNREIIHIEKESKPMNE